MKKFYSIIVLLAVSFTFITAQNLSGIRIYINPGHGGYDSDDRNVVIAPFKQGDPNGFWESKSNLDKGLYLRDMLQTAGATAFISRTTNTTADDLPLSQIVAAANASNADFMLSIHSNAGTTANSAVLMLFAGISDGDTNTYPTPTPRSNESKAVSTVIAQNLYSNKVTNWSSTYSVQGDKTFGRIAMGWSDGYGVLRGLTVPGVISEGSHHDYIPETYRLMNMEYKWLEAWHFLKSFATYFKSAQIPTGVIAGTVKDKFLLNDATYNKIPNTNDTYLPINGAKVTLNPGNLVYYTDNLNNGVYLFKDLQPGTYTILTEHADYHSETSTVVVTPNNVSYNNIRINRIRNTPPQVVEYSPNVALTDSVLASTVIRFRFNWDIDPVSAQNAFSMAPAVSGKFVFKEANFVMEFIPDVPLDKSTIYTVNLAKTLKHYDDLSMVDDFSFQFKTASRNQLKLIAAYPLINEKNIDYVKPTFTFVFDKQLQTSELINGVQVYDENGKIVTKNMRSLKHNAVQSPYGSTAFTLAQDLTANKSYTVKIAKGIKDIDGVYLTDTLYIPFTTSNERIIDKKIIEKFETTNLMSVDNTQSNMLASSSVLPNSTTKLFDAYSYNLKYNFSGKSGGEVFYKFNTPSIKLQADSVVGLHIYGDLSGNEMYLVLSSTDDTKLIKADSIHYGGWKFKEIELKSLIPSTDYYLTGLKIIQTTAPLSDIGNLFIDNLLVYRNIASSISSLKVSNVVVYPNPAVNTIHIKTSENQTLNLMGLYSLSGKILRTTKDKSMNVSDISAGTYIIKVTLNEGIVSVPIIIKSNK